MAKGTRPDDPFDALAKERRKEKCRNCIYFITPDLKCRIWPSDNLTAKKRQRGCTSFKQNIWGAAL